MSFTFQGKNIQYFYKNGSISVIPKFLTTEKAPTNEFEKNFPSRIIINGKDVNEQAISPYYDNTTTINDLYYCRINKEGSYDFSANNELVENIKVLKEKIKNEDILFEIFKKAYQEPTFLKVYAISYRYPFMSQFRFAT